MDAVQKIKKITRETEVLHKNALAEGRTEECIKIIEKIESMTVVILEEGTDARKVLGEMSEMRKKGGGEEAKVRSVTRSFLQAMKEFEWIQEAYKSKYRQQLERQYKLVYPEGTVDFGPLSDSQTSLILSQQIFRLAEDSRVRKELESMKARDAEMNQLEKGVEEVRQIFEDISILVREQGDMIDKVEDYVIEIQGNVRETVTILEKSVQVHKARQKKRRMAFAVSVMILTVLIGIILNELFPNLIPAIFEYIFSGF